MSRALPPDPFPTEPPVLELVGVSKHYPGSPPVEALREVDLHVRAGELLAVAGPSGSGKSTLLHLMGSLDRPSAGTVRIAGRDISTLGDAALAAVRAHEVGFVFQQFFLLDGLTALENVAEGLLYRGERSARRRARAVDVLERVGLAHRLDHRPTELSGGERQRVAIARAIVNEPSVVLADEPTGNLDRASGEAVVGLLRALHDTGRTIVVITHDRDLAASFPRRVELVDGRITADTGSPRRPTVGVAT
jgi:putative ABC transport system ATP-binding protein